MWILRWPVALALLLFVVAACLLPAGATTARQLEVPQLAAVSAELAEYAATPTWIEAGLWYGAALFLFVAAIRLMRRTQAFWAWLIGFGLYGARWGLARQNEDAALPTNLDSALSDYGLVLLAGLLAAGLLILLIDAADRAHWARREA